MLLLVVAAQPLKGRGPFRACPPLLFLGPVSKSLFAEIVPEPAHGGIGLHRRVLPVPLREVEAAVLVLGTVRVRVVRAGGRSHGRRRALGQVCEGRGDEGLQLGQGRHAGVWTGWALH
jgi:hypothetical protein